MRPTRSIIEGYLRAFEAWVNDDFKPSVFVTLRLPQLRRMPREEIFYVTLLARRTEATLLGSRTLKLRDDERRIRWVARREMKAGLVHYHALVKFPHRFWRDERSP